MTNDERERHMRRMLEHGRKVQEQFKRDNAKFDEDCRRFWDFMRQAVCRDADGR